MRKSVSLPFMFVAASMARNTASTGPSPSASASNVPCSACEMVTAARLWRPVAATTLKDELALEGADLVRGDGLEVSGGHGLLMVGYLLEAYKGPFENLALDVVAELFKSVL